MGELQQRAISDEDLRILAGALQFNGVAVELRKCLPSLTLLVCESGHVLIEEGEIGSEVYVILKGSVTVRRSRWMVFSKDVARLKAGDFFGEIGFLMPTVRSASVIANGPCELF